MLLELSALCNSLANREIEEADPVDCKVEDTGYTVPASPTWSSGSPTSPIEGNFGGANVGIPSSHGGGAGHGYSRTSHSERWIGQGESLLSPLIQRQDVTWGTTASTLSSMGRRRDDNVLQPSENWSLHNHPPRWQGQSQDATSPTLGGAVYQDRSRMRSTHHYDETHMPHRRDSESLQGSYSVRYAHHPPTTREGALQRLHYTSDNRDLRRSSHTHASFTTPSNSPSLPFPSQGYQNPPTYTSSWTSSDTSLLTTPTLHSISNQTDMAYGGTYNSNTASIVSSPDDYGTVDNYRDS